MGGPTVDPGLDGTADEFYGAFNVSRGDFLERRLV